MTPNETRRRACLAFLIILIVLFDAFILAFGEYIDLSVDIRPEPSDILRAQEALVAAWLVFGSGHRAWRAAWSVIAIAFLWTLGMKYRADTNTAYQIGELATLSLLSDSIALMACLLIFAAQRKLTGLTLATKSDTGDTVTPLRFRLRDVLLIVAACALVAFLLRSVVEHRYPRIPLTIRRPPMSNIWPLNQLAMLGIDNLTRGLFAAPGALVVLKPNRRSWLWVVYFFLICAIEPWIDLWLLAGSLTAAIPPNQTVMSILISFVPVVADNVWWYGVGLVPTLVVFVLLRGAGVQVRETKQSPQTSTP